jgi:hypothetical protein
VSILACGVKFGTLLAVEVSPIDSYKPVVSKFGTLRGGGLPLAEKLSYESWFWYLRVVSKFKFGTPLLVLEGFPSPKVEGTF